MRAGRGTLIAVVAIAASAVTAAASTVTLSASGDTYVRSSATNANQGTDTFLRVNTSPLRTLVRFDQSGIVSAATGMVLLSASLDLFVQSANNWGPGRPVEAHRMSADWTEAGATWNCAIDSDPSNSQPDCASQWAGGSFAAAATDAVVQTDALVSQYVSFDVTADVAAFLTGAANFGWMVRKQNESDGGTVDYTSREGTLAQRPRLVLNLAVPTSTATATSTATRTATVTSTPTRTSTATATSTRTASATPSATATASATPTRTSTATGTFTATHTPTVTSTPTPDPNCPPAPLVGCKQPLAANKALLLLKNKGGAGDKLVWKWVKGEATASQEFGDPIGATTYSLCVYDESGGVPMLRSAALVPPGAAWSANSKGFKYSDHAAAVAGIKTILLKSGDAGKTKILVKGGGDALDLPPLPLQQDPQVVVQLKNTFESGHCWEARFSGPAKKNDSGVFKDKGDAPVPTPTASLTASVSATPTASVTVTPSPLGPTATASATATATDSPTVTATASDSPTPTDTPFGGPPTATSTATPTGTSTPSLTPTPTATPTMSSSVCGNGILEPGENCGNCPADCTVLSCTGGMPLQTFRINFTAPLGSSVKAVSSLVGYRSNRVSLPGSGSGPSTRVKNRPPSTSQLVNDLDYAVRVVIQANGTATIPDGRLYTVDFDTCSGAMPVTPADFACQVESCGSSFGPIDGCTCVVTTAP